MSDFIITTDSTADLPSEFFAEHQVGLLSIPYVVDGVSYDENEALDYKLFYDKMRQGSMPTTSQINPLAAKHSFETYIKEGYDILHISFSSGLSGSCNSTRIAAIELEEQYPERKIKIIDSLCASLGEGLFVYKAVKLKEEGKSLDEIICWLEQNKLNLCHYFTVDDLNHLYRGGRVSKLEAVCGTLMNIKPILHVDDNGKLIVIGKVRGRKNSLKTLVDNMEKQIGNFENDIIFISHGDALEDAEYVKKLITERFGIQNFLINPIGPTVGTHSGPGTIALFFLGEKR